MLKKVFQILLTFLFLIPNTTLAIPYLNQTLFIDLSKLTFTADDSLKIDWGEPTITQVTNSYGTAWASDQLFGLTIERNEYGLEWNANKIRYERPFKILAGSGDLLVSYEFNYDVQASTDETGDWIDWIMYVYGGIPPYNTSTNIPIYDELFFVDGISYYNSPTVLSFQHTHRHDHDPYYLNEGETGYFELEIGENLYGADNYTTHPVPEPATLLLTCTGLISLAGYFRKRHKKIL